MGDFEDVAPDTESVEDPMDEMAGAGGHARFEDAVFFSAEGEDGLLERFQVGTAELANAKDNYLTLDHDVLLSLIAETDLAVGLLGDVTGIVIHEEPLLPLPEDSDVMADLATEDTGRLRNAVSATFTFADGTTGEYALYVAEKGFWLLSY